MFFLGSGLVASSFTGPEAFLLLFNGSGLKSVALFS